MATMGYKPSMMRTGGPLPPNTGVVPPHMRTGGPLPPSSPVIPRTGGPDPATPMPPMRTGGPNPPQRLPDVRTGGPFPPTPAPPMRTGGNTPPSQRPMPPALPDQANDRARLAVRGGGSMPGMPRPAGPPRMMQGPRRVSSTGLPAQPSNPVGRPVRDFKPPRLG